MSDKACTNCKLIVEDVEVCPNCKNNKFSDNWQGRVFINNPDDSVVAEKMGVEDSGEYAIKVK